MQPQPQPQPQPLTVAWRLTLFLQCIVVTSVIAQETSQQQAGEPAAIAAQTPHHFSRTFAEKQELEYLLFLPRDYRADRDEGWPLMLFLHGAGERGSDLSHSQGSWSAEAGRKGPRFSVCSGLTTMSRWRNVEHISPIRFAG